MKAIRILRNNIVESFKGIFRNFSLSFASILCISITLLLVGFSILLTLNVNNFTKNVENDMTIVVFLERKTKADDIDEVEKQINDLNNIKEITYNSKESVKASMEEESEIKKKEKIC